MIPKIIHQTAPKDKSRWHPIWSICHQSWKDRFPEPEYKHILWSDEDLDIFIKEQCNEYYDIFCNFPLTIMKIDFARYCILYSYGGIYADMDLYCHKNFYNKLMDEVYILESFPEFGEIVQNSLMVSIDGHEFWKHCLEFIKYFIKNNSINQIEDKCNYVIESCGPKMLSRVYDKYRDNVTILSKKIYNSFENLGFNFCEVDSKQHKEAFKKFEELCKKDDDIIIRNYTTGRWGKDNPRFPKYEEHY